MTRRIEIRWLLLLTLLAALVLATADLLTATISIVLLAFAGVLFGIFLNRLSRAVSYVLPLGYTWAYMLVLVILVGGGTAGAVYLGSSVSEKIMQLQSQLRKSSRSLETRLENQEWLNTSWQSLVSPGEVLPQVAQGMWSALWVVTGAIVILAVGMYLAYDPALYRRGLLAATPREHREKSDRLLHETGTVLARWLVGRFFSMAVIGVATAVGLSLLGVPLPMTLGVIAALLTFIPNIGPLAAAVPQALLALDVGPNTVLYVLALNVVLQTVESYLLTPLVQRYEVSLPPAVTIMAQLLMGLVAGVIGVMTAAPLTAAGLAVAKKLFAEDEGDRSENRG